MHTHNDDKATFSTAVWALILLCVVVVVFTIACGAAYTGVENARLTAAKASLGHIESVFYLAEQRATAQGLTPPEGSYENLLKSYDSADSANLPDYEKFVLNSMLEIFGPARDFDFAVERYQDGAGMKTTIYYYPVKGRTDNKSDPHYILRGGRLVQ